MSSKGRAVGLNLLVALLLILGSQELLNVGVAAANGPGVGGPSQDKNSNSDPCYRLCVKTLKGQGVDKDIREVYCNYVFIDMGIGYCGAPSSPPLICSELIDMFPCWKGETTTCDIEYPCAKTSQRH